MSKAVFVMNMPSKCNKCLLFDDEYDLCIPLGKDASDYRSETKPDWCPLRELPQKQTVHCTDTTHHRHAKDGWNHCIDEILK